MLGPVHKLEGDEEALNSVYRMTNDTHHKHSLESDTSIYLTTFYDFTPSYS